MGRKRFRGYGHKWECLCSCGKTKRIFARNLRRIIDCGCGHEKRMKAVGKKRRKSAADIWINKNFCMYKGNAKTKGYPFSISRDEFISLATRRCFYCNALPRKFRMKDGRTAYLNGLDRVNNRCGYTKRNTVPCCTYCNYKKGDENQLKFISWAIQVAKIARVRLVAS